MRGREDERTRGGRTRGQEEMRGGDERRRGREEERRREGECLGEVERMRIGV